MSVKVDQALVSSFINGGFGLPIAHENSHYDPTLGTAYAELTVFSSGAASYTLSTFDEQVGLFQVILRYPAGTGAIPAKQKADQIFSHFKIHSVHTYQGQSVRITRHDRPHGVPEEGWYKLVLRMRYQAFTAR